jgi:antitoxin component YwqK of YwqJK toxin-antitoxin module
MSEPVPMSEPDPRREPEPEEVLYRDGSLRARGATLDGEMHGHWQWFRLDGTPLRSGSFDRGRRIGVWTTYDRAGAPHKETRFGD